MEEQVKELRNILVPIARSVPKCDSHVQTISSAVGLFTNKQLTSIEPHVTALAARLCAFETGAASSSGISGSSA